MEQQADCDILTWRRPERFLVDVSLGFVILAGLVLVGVGLNVPYISSWIEVDGGSGGTILAGLAIVALSLTRIVREHRPVLVLEADTLFIQNAIRSRRVMLSEVVELDYSKFDFLRIVYMRDGCRAAICSSAGEGSSGTIFSRPEKNKRGHLISAAIADRIQFFHEMVKVEGGWQSTDSRRESLVAAQGDATSNQPESNGGSR